MSGESSTNMRSAVPQGRRPDEDSMSVEPSLMTVIVTVIVIVFVACIFTLVAAVVTIVVFDVKPAYWLYGFYWGLFARCLLAATEKNALLLSRKDRTKRPDERMTVGERRFVMSLFLWLIRLELAASLVLLILSVAGRL